MALLHGADYDRATQIATCIAHDLSEWMDDGGVCPAHSGSIGEFAGQHAGICLMFLELARATGDRKWHDQAVACWVRSVERIGEQTCGPDFFMGFTGAAWVGEILERFTYPSDSDAISDGADDDALSEIDEAALAALTQRAQLLPDLLGGVSGLGLYVALRAPRQRAVQGLQLLIDWLDRAAVSDARGVYWTPAANLLSVQADSSFYSEGCAPLGTAHGLAGILSVVARSIEAGVAVKSATRLFEGGVEFLLASRLQQNNRVVFPSSIHRDGSFADPHPSWCWGDIGIIGALHAAALRVGHVDLEKAMIDAAIGAATVVPSRCPMHDASLCHGTAGRAHILNRLYQSVGDDRLAIAGKRWFRATFGQRTSLGFGGYRFRVRTGADYRRLASPGVLLGSAGVALALLSACSSLPPLWDVPFAVDAPHVAGSRAAPQ
jgi:hypothetical protein